MAIRIPAGWLDPALEVTLERDPSSGSITVSQRGQQLKALFARWATEPEIVDDSFTEALRREPSKDPRSIFEIQAAEENTDAAN